jgi:hypothetical protein
MVEFDAKQMKEGCERIFSVKLQHDYQATNWIEGSMAVCTHANNGDFIITKWEIIPGKNVEIRSRGSEEGKTSEKRAALKDLWNKLTDNVPIEEIKKEVNCKLIEEGLRWKIYSKAVELWKMNKFFEDLALMKIIDGVITERGVGFF